MSIEDFKHQVKHTLTKDSLQDADVNKSVLKLKKELFSLVGKYYRVLGLITIENVNNFDYKAFSEYLIKKNYSGNPKKLAYYSFKHIDTYYQVLDFIIVYTQQIINANYSKHTIKELEKKSLTEILMLRKEDIESLGLSLTINSYQLSKNYKTNPYIKRYLDLLEDVAPHNYLETVKDKDIFYYQLSLDIIESLHTKTTKYSYKNKLFWLEQCFRHLSFDKDYKIIFEQIIKDFKLPLNDKDIQGIYSATTYKSKEQTIRARSL